MTQDTEHAIRSVRGLLIAKYPGYLDKPNSERLVLAFAYCCDVLKVREQGTNRGMWVVRFLDSAGVGPGNPWCASALTFACRVAEVPVLADRAASVAAWHEGVVRTRRAVDKPQRGDICMKNSGGGKGHIGVVVKVIGPLVYSIEGNTSSGEAGSQRDGDGLYRRVRTKAFWSWGFGRL